MDSHNIHTVYSRELFLVRESFLSNNQLFKKYNRLFNLPLGKQNQQKLIQAKQAKVCGRNGTPLTSGFHFKKSTEFLIRLPTCLLTVWCYTRCSGGSLRHPPMGKLDKVSTMPIQKLLLRNKLIGSFQSW